MLLLLTLLQFLVHINDFVYPSNIQERLSEPYKIHAVDDSVILIVDTGVNSVFRIQNGQTIDEIVGSGNGPNEVDMVSSVWSDDRRTVVTGLMGKVVILNNHDNFKQTDVFYASKSIFPITHSYLNENQLFIGGRPIDGYGNTILKVDLDNQVKTPMLPASPFYIEYNLDSFLNTVPRVFDDTLYVVQSKDYTIFRMDTEGKVLLPIKPERNPKQFKSVSRVFDPQNSNDYKTIRDESAIPAFWKHKNVFIVVHYYTVEGEQIAFLDILSRNGELMLDSFPIPSPIGYMYNDFLSFISFDKKQEAFTLTTFRISI